LFRHRILLRAIYGRALTDEEVQVLCGSQSRHDLVSQSGREGKPITYGAYGEGERPLLFGSVSRNEPGDYVYCGDTWQESGWRSRVQKWS